MFLARHEGWMPNKEIVFLETTSATDSLNALAEGKVDGAALTLDEVLRARNKGIPLTVILVFDVSAGADVVLARPHIKSIRDLAGKRIGVEQSAIGALMLQKVTEASGQGTLKADIISTTPDMHLADWNKGKLDAIITYEPVATQIQANGFEFIAKPIYPDALLRKVREILDR
jgi:NitT/TauT family transport system substrate-binding protein